MQNQQVEDRLLSNAELMSLLNHKVKKNIDLTSFEYFVYREHETQTARPLYHKRRLLKLAEYLKQFNFTPQEKIVIVNYPPTSLVEFYSVVPNPSQFSDEEANKFMKDIEEIMQMELLPDQPKKVLNQKEESDL
ncbi:hypothetical protein ENUP19_0146G0018 [Entamoeba nuttalli]|uniref:DNA-directed RNA polymerase III subunit RPC9 n=2 Tax=Entamoeba nuttalli TaxID=412467 RepID=K2I0A5_ENTNP|nr:hypothetical protein ENU1_030290 [Entamoeba nuttalli P19]EKE42165.1 hypothetical protein ENU1_030290 [Entamoeba nuttalli P19]|eukprot:XP_008855501.1 hypothetical protein ENU1_030290 [Entamoeba nuttalli P19]